MQSNNIAPRTDGCAGQYKRKHSFGIISTSEQHHSTSMSTTSLTIVQVDMAKGKWTKLLDFFKLQQREQS